MKLDEHLGRRKPDGAQALHAAAGQLGSLRASAAAVRAQLEAALRDWPASLASAREVLLLTEPQARAVGEAWAIGAPLRRTRLRTCDRRHPELLRAALGALESSAEVLFSPAWERIARALPFACSPLLEERELLAPAAPPSLASLPGLQQGHLLGADIPAQLEVALAFAKQAEGDGLEGPALRLGALLAGLADRGPATFALSAPGPLAPLAELLFATSCARPATAAPALQLVEGDPLREPNSSPTDRLLLVLRREGEPPDPRLRRLIAAGVPVLQLELPGGPIGASLALLEIALACAQQGPASPSTHPSTDDADAAALLGTPALSQPPLSLFATPAHAYILGRVAATLGKSAATSIPHWLAAQLALADPGEVICLHLCTTSSAARTSGLASLRRALASAIPQGVRISPGLRDLPDVTHAARALTSTASPTDTAGTSARTLHFIISDGGGADLRVGGTSLRQRALADEARAFTALAAADCRVVLLRSDTDDQASLFAALTQAAELLQR